MVSVSLMVWVGRLPHHVCWCDSVKSKSHTFYRLSFNNGNDSTYTILGATKIRKYWYQKRSNLKTYIPPPLRCERGTPQPSYISYHSPFLSCCSFWYKAFFTAREGGKKEDLEQSLEIKLSLTEELLSSPSVRAPHWIVPYVLFLLAQDIKYMNMFNIKIT